MIAVWGEVAAIIGGMLAWKYGGLQVFMLGLIAILLYGIGRTMDEILKAIRERQ